MNIIKSVKRFVPQSLIGNSTVDYLDLLSRLLSCRCFLELKSSLLCASFKTYRPIISRIRKNVTITTNGTAISQKYLKRKVKSVIVTQRTSMRKLTHRYVSEHRRSVQNSFQSIL